MLIRTVVLIAVVSALGACAGERAPVAGGTGGEPLVIGESFGIDSGALGERRRINVFIPTVYGQKIDAPMAVLYMPDGGLDEDFLHIAGLVQVLVSDGSMRPFMLVGIPNTARRRDLTGPTASAEDRKIAPVVGGSAAYRRFIREELMPAVRTRYRTTDESAIIGESLAGLFVVETFFLEPELFGSYIAVDPSLWWAEDALVRSAEARLAAGAGAGRSLFLANSDEPRIAGLTARLAGILDAHRTGRERWVYAPMAAEGHGTIYHPAALLGLRTMLAPPPAVPGPGAPGAGG